MIKGLALVLILTALYSGIVAQTFNITDFGAIPNGLTLNTKSIQKAIDSCTANGGGTVYIPSGIFISGTLELKSNVNLYLESGAELKGSPDLADYKPYKSPIFETPSNYGIIYAHKAYNVSITGQGAINGNEEVFFEWDKAKSIEWGGCQFTRQKDRYRAVDSGIGDGPVKPKDRPRQMVIFSDCKNVLVRDIQLIKSPFWTLHFADCDGVNVSGVKIWASLFTPNSDGIDITSCNNVTVSNCDIRTGDDAIVITGYAHHYELPGYENLIHKSENFCITNCNLQSRSSGIRLGFIDQNSIKNIHISNINITNSNRGIGIFVRGSGSVENVTISQVNIETRLHTGDWWGNGEPIHISAVRGEDSVKLGQIKNVTFRDITCTAENGILLYGSDESIIEDIRFENVRFKLVNSKLNDVAGGNIDLRGTMGERQLFASDISAFYAQYVNDLKLHDCVISWAEVKEPYFRHGIHVKEFNGLQLTGVKTSASPSNRSLKAVFIENGKNFTTDLNKKGVESSNVAIE
ncbi:MAG: glycosyl hydrolase family 28 protein [Salinivirgaceae bacterium]|jgi:polygalacturonase|nr:glycosyl hydrolase family 28 protein [Salinivirgaceae bacterium]